MKTKVICLTATMALLAMGYSFEMPRGFKRVTDLSAAQSEAYENHKPVVYLISKSALEPS